MSAHEASGEVAGAGLTAGEYINHHLHNWQIGSGFWTVNLDTVAYALLLGALSCLVMWSVARRMTSGVPGRLQAAVEFLVEWVDTEARGIVHNEESRKFVGPMALTVFVWIVLMNAMDLLPVDLLPWAWQTAQGDHGAYMRVVPTADLSATMAMSVTVLLICIYYNIKIKGPGGWLHELFTAPFGNHFLLYPFNFALQIIEFVSKTVSHGMRLFGNMYAGELVFLLIALMGGAFFSAVGIPLSIGHIIAGTFWAIFHILIILLQAFVFMMLALVYVGQAHDSH